MICDVCKAEVSHVYLSPPGDATARCAWCCARHEKKPEPRKPYTPPAVKEEATFEGLALKCGQIGEDCGAGASGAS